MSKHKRSQRSSSSDDLTPYAPAPKVGDFKGSIKKLISYIGTYKFTMLFAFILAIISTIFAVVGPRIMGEATNEIFEGVLSGNFNFARIAQILLFLVALYVISSLCSFIQGYIMTGVSAKITYRIRKEADNKIHSLPISYFDKNTHGDTISRVVNDIDVIGQNLTQNLTQIISSLTTVVGIVVIMLTISWQMTLIAALIIPVSLSGVGTVFRKSQKHFVRQQKYLGDVNGSVEEMFSAHQVVRAFNGEQAALEEFNKHNNALYKSAWKANFLSGLLWPLTRFASNLGYVGVCIMGSYLAITGQMRIGYIQAFIQYIRALEQPLAQTASLSNTLQQMAAACERVFEFLEEEEEPPDINTTNLPQNATVEFNNIHFGYEPNKTVINNFTAHISQGQKVAIVGPTGAGKTTIVKLLMRFYDVTSGSIKIGGYDIRELRRSDLHKMLGMVLQDTWLFGGTIADNIRYGKLTATDEEVKTAAKSAQVDHFVHTLPGDYNMILNEEANNVSQGQKQLITIARAILADPQILILDEATSSVDTRTEVLIQKAMDNLMKGRTSFIIAHRLSTIRNADLILVMENGDIVEQGTHTSLLAQNGAYAKLYSTQFEPTA